MGNAWSSSFSSVWQYGWSTYSTEGHVQQKAPRKDAGEKTVLRPLSRLSRRDRCKHGKRWRCPGWRTVCECSDQAFRKTDVLFCEQEDTRQIGTVIASWLAWLVSDFKFDQVAWFWFVASLKLLGWLNSFCRASGGCFSMVGWFVFHFFWLVFISWLVDPSVWLLACLFASFFVSW